MSKGMKTLLIIAVLVVLVVGGYKWRYPTYSWHQKLVVEIETPDGSVVSGYTVTKVIISDVPNVLPDAAARTYDLYGEAAVVELANGVYLFALLPGMLRIGEAVFLKYDKKYYDKSDAGFAKVISSWPDREIVPEKYYPLLVTFDDINDPKTVKRVDPNDLDASFGCENSVSRAILAAPGPATARPDRPAAPSASDRSLIANKFSPSVAGQASATSGSASPRTGGGADAPAKIKKCYSLKSITLEITDEPVTKGVVEGVLGWFLNYKEKHYRFNGERCVACPKDDSFAAMIGTGNFRVGE